MLRGRRVHRGLGGCDNGPVEPSSLTRRQRIGGSTFLPTLLGVTTIVVVLLPFFTESTLMLRLVRSGLAALLVTAVWRLSEGKLTPYTVLLIVALDLIAQWLLVSHQLPALIVARNVLSLAFLAVTAGYLTVEIWRETEIRAHTFLIAVGLYLLIGLFWAIVFTLVEFLHPGSFANVCEPSPELAGCDDALTAYPQLYYLSFVTMTTLGYGDVLPLSHAAQGVATLAAVSGQLFVAILIGRVLGSYLGRSKDTGDS